MFLRSIKKFSPFFLIALAVLFLVPGVVIGADEAAEKADGGTFISKFATSAATDLFNGMLLGIQTIALGIVKIGAWLTSWALNLNLSLIQDIQSGGGFVLRGWTVFRDLANLGFVFGIILIAVATILRFRSYAAQQILWKLIVAALLVNFSLVIAGGVVSISDVFSRYFIRFIGGGDGVSKNIETLSDKLGGVFHPEDIANPWIAQYKQLCKVDLAKENLESPVSGVAMGWDVTTKIAGFIGDITGSVDDAYAQAALEQCIAQKIQEFEGSAAAQAYKNSLQKQPLSSLSLAISIIVLLLIFVVLLTLGGLFVVRYFYLAFLFIVSPFALLLWIFPHTKKNWDEWWHQLIKWTIFAPVNLFFIYLTLLVLSQSLFAVPESAGGTVGAYSFATIANALMPLFLLIAGMKISLKIGVAGSGFALNSAQKVGGWAKGKTQRGLARGTNWAFKKSGLEEKINQKAPQGRLARVTLGRFQRGVARVGQRLERASGQSYEDAKKKFSGYSDERLARVAGTAASDVEKAAIASLLQERGSLDEDTMRRLTGKTDLEEAKKQILNLKDYSERVGLGFGDIEKGVGRSKEVQDSMDRLAQITDKSSDEYARASEQLAKVTEDFAKKLSEKEWKGVARSAFGEDHPEGTPQAEYAKNLARFINDDPTGRRFGRAISGLEGTQVYTLLNALVRDVMPKHEESDVVTTQFDEVFESGVKEAQSSSGSEAIRKYADVYADVQGAFENSNDARQKKLAERIKKSVISDMISSSQKEEKKSGQSKPAEENTDKKETK